MHLTSSILCISLGTQHGSVDCTLAVQTCALWWHTQIYMGNIIKKISKNVNRIRRENIKVIGNPYINESMCAPALHIWAQLTITQGPACCFMRGRWRQRERGRKAIQTTSDSQLHAREVARCKRGWRAIKADIRLTVVCGGSGSGVNGV